MYRGRADGQSAGGMSVNVDGRQIERALTELNLPKTSSASAPCRGWSMAKVSSTDQDGYSAATRRYSCQCATCGPCL